jgi:hypothetical protein
MGEGQRRVEPGQGVARGGKVLRGDGHCGPWSTNSEADHSVRSMPSLDDLPVPITPSAFHANHDGRKPLAGAVGAIRVRA